jgi:hypothetical protein
MCIGVFPAQIDVALRRSRGDSRNRHTLDQYEGIALHHHAIRECARVAFIGIADDVFLGRGSAEHGFPFDPRRESGSAAAAQT